MEIVLMIMYGFLMFGLGVTWLYSIQDKISAPSKFPTPIKDLPSVIINDIELGSIRYYLKGNQVSPIRVDGLLLKDDYVYIQELKSSKSKTKFKNKNLLTTFETEDEATQILLSNLDNQFDSELQLLQEKYNEQLDTLI